MRFELRKPAGILVNGIGNIKLKIHEDAATPILQFISTKDLPTAGWIAFTGKTSDDGKETLCKNEYKVSSKNIMRYKGDKDIARPVVLSFDIEVNSTKIVKHHFCG